jgi:hypothetical protein
MVQIVTIEEIITTAGIDTMAVTTTTDTTTATTTGRKVTTARDTGTAAAPTSKCLATSTIGTTPPSSPTSRDQRYYSDHGHNHRIYNFPVWHNGYASYQTYAYCGSSIFRPRFGLRFFLGF